jgi:hypothetical protein
MTEIEQQPVTFHVPPGNRDNIPAGDHPGFSSGNAARQSQPQATTYDGAYDPGVVLCMRLVRVPPRSQRGRAGGRMKYRRNYWGTVVPVCLWVVHSATAAEFQKSTLQNGRDLITVVGDLSYGDEKTFINIALSSSDAIIVFQSRGGNLLAGIEIGKAIHLKGFSTLVPDGTLCSSACALAWLGGRTRYMGDAARVGFHAAYTDNDGRPNVSSAGNALVGAYLNQIGLPASAVIYITETSPDAMQLLTFADAQRYGIDVKPIAKTTPTTPEQQPQQSLQTPQGPKRPFRVVDVSDGFLQIRNGPGPTYQEIAKMRWAQLSRSGAVSHSMAAGNRFAKWNGRE